MRRLPLFAAALLFSSGLACNEGLKDGPEDEGFADDGVATRNGPGKRVKKGTKTGKDLGSADPDAPGEKVVQAPLPAEKAPKASPRVEGFEPSERVQTSFDSYFANRIGRRMYVQVDKPLYRPGETIWFKTWDLKKRDLGLDGQAGHLAMELISPKGAAVITKNVQSTGSGVTNDFVLPEGVQGGEYIVRATAPGGEVAERPIIVAVYEPPRVKKKLEFVRKAYGAGDEVTATVEVKRPTGEPLADQALQAVIKLDGQELPRVTFRTNDEGGALLRFTLPDQITLGDGLLTVLVEDGGVTESISKRVPIIMKKLDFSFFPEGGALVEGVPGRMYFEAKNTIGKPADVEGQIVDDRGNAVARFRSFDRGLGRVDFTPNTGRTYTAKITKPAGITETYPVPLPLEAGCALRSYDDYDGQERALRVGVRCSESQEVVVAATLRENLLDSAALKVEAGKESVVWLQPKDDALAAAQGAARVTLFDKELNPVAERLVYRNRRNLLQVEIEPDQESYTPREQVALKVRTTGIDGKPLPAEIALSVVDDTVISFADDKKGHMLAKLYVEPEVPGEIEEPKFYFDLTEEKSAQAMDLLMGTRGWRKFEWAPVFNPPMPVTSTAATRGGWGDADGFDNGMVLEEAVVLEGAVRKGGGAKRDKAKEAPRGRPAVQAPMQPAPAMDPAPPPAEPEPEAVAAQVANKPAAARPLRQAEAKKIDVAEREENRGRRAERGPADAAAGGMAMGRGDVAGADMLADEDMDWAEAEEAMPIERQAAVVWAPVRVFPVPDYSGVHDGPRSDFRETVFWAPTVKTDKSGEATVLFYLSDSVTSFRVFAEGAGDGLAGRHEQVFKSNLPFSMNVKLPLAVSEGDRMQLPLTLTNEQDSDLPFSLSASFGDLLTLKKPAQLGGPTLKASARQSLWYDVEVSGKQGTSEVSFSANAGGLTDEFVRRVTVEPLGFPQAASASGSVATKASESFDLGEATPGSVTAKVTLYPSPVASLVTGLEGMLREPGGCFEQTSSSNYPNIMVMQYLQATDGAAPELVQRTQGMLERGYQKLVGYETGDKGYEWFGSTPPHEALTAYGLVEFADMRAVFGGVDEKMMARTAAWIGSRRDGKGGFLRDGKALDSFGRADADVTDSYITWSLAEAGLIADFDKELGAQAARAKDSKDPYMLALAANTLLQVPARRAEGVAAAKRLAGSQQSNGSWTGAKHSITRSSGQNLDVETTSLAVLALMEADVSPEGVRKAIAWLTENRGGYGQWGATQATVLGLRALTDYAVRSRATRGSGRVSLLINGKQVASQDYAAGRRDPLEFDDLGQYFTSGANTVELVHSGEDELPYSVAVDFRSLKPATHPDVVVELETKLAADTVKMGESLRLDATLRNRTSEGQPMTLARVGLPGGLTFQTWQLEELRDKGTIAFYETRAREVVLYFRDLAPDAVIELPLDLVTTVPGTFTGPASSAYLYYTDDLRFWTDGEQVTVTR